MLRIEGCKLRRASILFEGLVNNRPMLNKGDARNIDNAQHNEIWPVHS